MQKYSRKLAALAAAASLALTGVLAGCSSADSDHKIRIGIKVDQPGLGYQDGNTYTGFDVEVARYVAGKLGYSEEQIEFVESPAANRENMLNTGQVDMIFATYSISESRKKTVDFAGPYYTAGQDLLVRADNTDIHGPDDLNGKNLCSVTGSTSAQKVQDKFAKNVNLVKQNSYSDCVVALNGGVVDAVTTDDITLAGLAATKANKGKLKVVGSPFTTERYGVGLPKGTDKCEAVNNAINEMVADGTWEKFITKYTEGTSYHYNTETNPPHLGTSCA